MKSQSLFQQKGFQATPVNAEDMRQQATVTVTLPLTENQAQFAIFAEECFHSGFGL